MTNTDLSYSDLVQAAGFISERLLIAEDAVLDLNMQLAATHGEIAALRGVLEYERERARELRNRLDDRRDGAVEGPHRSLFI